MLHIGAPQHLLPRHELKQKCPKPLQRRLGPLAVFFFFSKRTFVYFTYNNDQRPLALCSFHKNILDLKLLSWSFLLRVMV